MLKLFYLFAFFLTGNALSALAFTTTPSNARTGSFKITDMLGVGTRLLASSKGKIPTSTSERNNQAIDAVKEAIYSRKRLSVPLIECEFPALQALNRLGDGSQSSSLEAERNNIDFVGKLVKGIAPVPFLGPKIWIMTSTSSSKTFNSTAKSTITSATVSCLKNGIPDTGTKDICIFITPSSSSDYEMASRLAGSGTVAAVVIVNGYAKDQKSVPASATMAYFLKPLTYNSQVAGFLIRCYPGQWTVFDAYTNETLGTFLDSEILVRNTNTPDLRNPGKLVQKSVDDRAIRARRGD